MITLSIVPVDKARDAEALAAELEKAVSDGAMTKVDELSQALLAVTPSDRGIRIKDESWMELNRKVRLSMPQYTAAYLVDAETCSKLLRLIGDQEPNELRDLLEAVVASGSHLLQLPLDSE
jgi:hypothetical protein